MAVLALGEVSDIEFIVTDCAVGKWKRWDEVRKVREDRYLYGL